MSEQKATSSANVETGDAAMLAGNLDHVSTLWVQLHQELSTALGLEFEPNEDIERYTEAIASKDTEIARLRGELEAGSKVNRKLVTFVQKVVSDNLSVGVWATQFDRLKKIGKKLLADNGLDGQS